MDPTNLLFPEVSGSGRHRRAVNTAAQSGYTADRPLTLLERVAKAAPPIDHRPLWIQRMDRNAKVFSSCPDGRFDPGHGKSA